MVARHFYRSGSSEFDNDSFGKFAGSRVLLAGKIAWLIFIVSFLSLTPGFSGPLQKSDDRLRQEETEDYYRKWLTQDVVYIITDDERAVFEKLATPEEKENFIEQFWFRRDIDPTTRANEFKEEHYRRIAYANENFQSGLPGWQTDRGRIYIIHGPPDEIESHPSGGSYKRPFDEGGGYTSTFPFEIWRYRHIDGVGDNVELEFVDASKSGEYRLALLPEEKDALLYVPGAGLTLAESLGWAKKSDRPYFRPGTNYPYNQPRIQDDPFIRFQRFSQAKAPAEIRYRDLQQIVKAHVAFNDLPFRVQTDYLRLDNSQVLVPVTIEIPNQNLMFAPAAGHVNANATVYGVVTALNNRVVYEFDDDLHLSYQSGQLSHFLQGKSLYQRMIALDTGTRFKLELLVKDTNTDKVGIYRGAIVTPQYPDGRIGLSSLILAKSCYELGQAPSEPEMFVLGDLKVYPNTEALFSKEERIGLYFQIYNATIDQASQMPQLSISYRVYDGEKLRFEQSDQSGEYLRIYGSGRIAVVRSFDAASLGPGAYRIQITVQDRISGQEGVLEQTFRVTS